MVTLLTSAAHVIESGMEIATASTMLEQVGGFGGRAFVDSALQGRLSRIHIKKSLLYVRKLTADVVCTQRRL